MNIRNLLSLHNFIKAVKILNKFVCPQCTGPCLCIVMCSEYLYRVASVGCVLELETKVHPKVRNHGEGPY